VRRRPSILIAGAGLAVAVAAAAVPGAPASRESAPTRIRDAQLQLIGEGAAASTRAPAVAARPAAPRATAAPRPTRTWLGYDGRTGRLYPKNFVLMANGTRAQVWVARNISFPAGDCRNRVDRGTRVRITPAQAAYLARQFDRRIYPRETQLFGLPRPRDGRNAERRYAGPRNRKLVVLVDNVRDENFLDRNNSRNLSYIAGFFSAQLTRMLDRNIVTIDAYDWTHRMRANPPHRPVVGNNCRSAPARPFLYEGVLAHEYAHLLQEAADPRERDWVQEGLADYAMSIAGYTRPALGIDRIGFDSHVQCILGWSTVLTDANPQPRPGGPENSLTLWGDAGDDKLLCDYGAAYTFVQFLADRHGAAAAGALHRDQSTGLTGVDRVLAQLAAPGTSRQLIHDWAAMLALDGIVDRGTPITGGGEAFVTSRALRATVNWANPSAYASPGAPPNGSDYVRLRAADGRFLTAAELTSLSFAGQSRRGGGTFAVQLIAYGSDPSVPATRAFVPLDGSLAGSLDEATLRGLVDPRADVVAAIVTYEDPQERLSDYGRYTLTANGVGQPGG
jgi:hypothetical protein